MLTFKVECVFVSTLFKLETPHLMLVHMVFFSTMVLLWHCSFMAVTKLIMVLPWHLFVRHVSFDLMVIQ